MKKERETTSSQRADRFFFLLPTSARPSIPFVSLSFFLSSRLSVCVCHEAKQSSKPVGVANLEAIDGVEEEGNKRSAGGAAQHSTALGFMGF